MNSQQALLKAKLDKRAKELDAREESLNAEEAIVNSRLKDLADIERDIKTAEFRLKNIKREREEALTVLDNEKVDLEDKITLKAGELVDTNEKVRVASNTLNDTVRDTKDTQRSSDAQLRETNKQIAERQEYQKEQEDLITKAVDTGNEKLLSVKYELQGLEQQKEPLLKEIYDLTVQKETLEQDVSGLENRLKAMDSRYSTKANELRQALIDKNKEIADANTKYNALEAKIAEPTKQLKLKEEELIARENAVRKSQADLATQKRRFDSRVSIYGN